VKPDDDWTVPGTRGKPDEGWTVPLAGASPPVEDDWAAPRLRRPGATSDDGAAPGAASAPVQALGHALRPGTWVGAGLVVTSAVAGTVLYGTGGLVAVLGVAAALTALFVVATGRESWALLSSRKAGAVVLVAGVVVAAIGGVAVERAIRSGNAEQVDEQPQQQQPGPQLPAEQQPGSPAAASDPSPASVLEPEPEPLPAPVPDEPGTALALLATLPVKGKAPSTGYDRTGLFGEAWLDVDGNGCSTRDDVLARDLVEVVRRDACIIETGVLLDPYTGATIAFDRGWGTSGLVQIDHVVALANAWKTGAQQLSQEQRVAFANDPLNLLAVDGPANMQKSDGDAATWLPQSAYRCQYVARQVSVKARYALWVTPPELEAMTGILAECPGQPIVSALP